MGSKSTFSLSGDLSERTELGQGPDVESQLTSLAAEYAYRLSPRLSIVGLVLHSEEDDAQGGSTRDYTENQYRLTLRTEF